MNTFHGSLYGKRLPPTLEDLRFLGSLRRAPLNVEVTKARVPLVCSACRHLWPAHHMGLRPPEYNAIAGRVKRFPGQFRVVCGLDCRCVVQGDKQLILDTFDPRKRWV